MKRTRTDCGRLLLFLFSAVLLSAQTGNRNATEKGTIDFSGATHTMPAKTGVASAKPGTCSAGELYFATDATLGQSLYLCQPANTWTQQLNSGGGGGASSVTQLMDCQVTKTDATHLGIAAPCNVRIGTTVYGLTTSAVVTLASGSGTAYIYADSTGALTVGFASPVSLSCDTHCTATSAISAFPAGSAAIYTWAASSGAWASTGTDFRGVVSAPPVLTADTGATVTPNGNGYKVGLDPTGVTRSHTLQFVFDGGGSALSTTTTPPMILTFGCSAVNWSVAVDAGTATVKLWKKASSTGAIPTVSDSISISGFPISSGTVTTISTTLTDLTATTYTTGDVFIGSLSAVSGATKVTLSLGCNE